MTQLNNPLSELPNIGSTLAAKLEEAGIHNLQELTATGSEGAFIRIRTIDPGACINMLYALEGAIGGIRWHNLDRVRKQELKEFFGRL